LEYENGGLKSIRTPQKLNNGDQDTHLPLIKLMEDMETVTKFLCFQSPTASLKNEKKYPAFGFYRQNFGSPAFFLVMA
jgi:hypothetical protein